MPTWHSSTLIIKLNEYFNTSYSTSCVIIWLTMNHRVINTNTITSKSNSSKLQSDNWFRSTIKIFHQNMHVNFCSSTVLLPWHMIVISWKKATRRYFLFDLVYFCELFRMNMAPMKWRQTMSSYSILYESCRT